MATSIRQAAESSGSAAADRLGLRGGRTAPARAAGPEPFAGAAETAGLSPLGGLLLGRLLQAKLRVGPAGDSYEQQADRVADALLAGGMGLGPAGGPAGSLDIAAVPAQVQRRCAQCDEEEARRQAGGPAVTEAVAALAGPPGSALQRKCSCQEEPHEELLQARALPGGARPGVAASAGDELTARVAVLGGGAPLTPELRRFFEPRFGQDFAAVRVHTGAAAHAAAAAARARAFTLGRDLVFGAGEYAPETRAGRHLLAHELTHVVQQTPVARRRPLAAEAPTPEPAPVPGVAGGPTADGSGGPEPAPAAEPAAPAPGAPKPEAAPEAAPEEASPVSDLIVEDSVEAPAAGQMKKSEFLDQLHAAVCAAAEAGLAGTEHSAQGCPLIDFWFGYYAGVDAARMNRDLPRFAPAGERPETAAGYVPLIAARVQQSVAAWARTGEISGVPEGLPLPGMGLVSGLLGGGAGLGGGLGGAAFKAGPGGPRPPRDASVLAARLGPGSPLDGGVRARMESVFGRSFAPVRVHTEGAAGNLAQEVNARALAVGEHVAFGPQQYRPGTLEGDALIAHELAHVAQQGGAAPGAGPGGASGAALERDADLAAAGAVAALWGGRFGGLLGRLPRLPRPAPRLRSGLRLQRCNCNCGPEATTATTPGGTAAVAACEPQLVSLDELRGDTIGSTPGHVTFGKTEPPSFNLEGSDVEGMTDFCMPRLVPDPQGATCTVTPRPLPQLELSSKSIRRGDYPVGISERKPGCPGEVPAVLRVSPGIEGLARQAEQEHCADYREAFNQTLKPCHDAVQALAGTKVSGGDQDRCKTSLVAKLGFDPRDCGQAFFDLSARSIKRDFSGWHTFNSPQAGGDCQQSLHVAELGARTQIPGPPPREVIGTGQGCGAAAPAPHSEAPVAAPGGATPAATAALPPNAPKKLAEARLSTDVPPEPEKCCH